MKTCNLILTSKNRDSLQKLLLFLNKNSDKNFNSIKIFFSKKQSKKIITILKSPHVNKKAQEQFEINFYSAQLTINIRHIFKFLIFIKKIKNFIFSDINIKVKIFNSKKKQKILYRKTFSIDNYKTKSLILNSNDYQNCKLKILKQFNKNIYEGLTLNCLNSNNLLKLFDIYGNKIIEI